MARKHMFYNIDSTYSIVFFIILLSAVHSLRFLMNFCAHCGFVCYFFGLQNDKKKMNGCTLSKQRYCLCNIKHLIPCGSKDTPHGVGVWVCVCVSARYSVNCVSKCCTIYGVYYKNTFRASQKIIMNVWLLYAKIHHFYCTLYTIIWKTKKKGIM